VAAVTPCTSNGKFDQALYKELMPFLKQRGADGVVVCGTTGEFPSFSVAERKRIAEAALKHRSGLDVIVQVGTPNLPETLELLAHAAANGASEVLCIPPFYFKNPSVAGLTKYYSHVLEAARIPVHLYHYPGVSAVPISLELMHNLEHYPKLAGIKDSTGNAEGYAAFVKEFPKLNMMTGTDNNLPTGKARTLPGRSPS
jgi:4-hydroxy-tetrahydrodipicolinate synthase